MVLFHQFEGKIITALNKFPCRKLPKDLGPKWLEFKYKIRNSCFSLITAIFPFSFSILHLCCVSSSVLISWPWKQALLVTLGPNLYEYSFEITYLHTNLFPVLCSSQPLFHWTSEETAVYSYLFSYFAPLNIHLLAWNLTMNKILISLLVGGGTIS